MIQFRDITVRRQQRLVLDHVNLDLPKGAGVLVFGETGSGKSTLLSLLLGLRTPDSGSVMVDGLSVAALSRPQRERFLRSTSIVLQQEALVPSRSVKENFLLTRVRKSEAEVMLHFLRLQEWADVKVRDLSFGQQKLTDIGRALLPHSSLIVWDDPFQLLDTRTARRIGEYVLELHKAGKTVLLSTSQTWVADLLAARGMGVVELVQGKLAGYAPATSIGEDHHRIVSTTCALEHSHGH